MSNVPASSKNWHIMFVLSSSIISNPARGSHCVLYAISVVEGYLFSSFNTDYIVSEKISPINLVYYAVSEICE